MFYEIDLIFKRSLNTKRQLQIHVKRTFYALSMNDGVNIPLWKYFHKKFIFPLMGFYRHSLLRGASRMNIFPFIVVALYYWVDVESSILKFLRREFFDVLSKFPRLPTYIPFIHFYSNHFTFNFFPSLTLNNF